MIYTFHTQLPKMIAKSENGKIKLKKSNLGGKKEYKLLIKAVKVKGYTLTEDKKYFHVAV